MSTTKQRDIMVPDAVEGCEGLARMAGLNVSVLNNLHMPIHHSFCRNFTQ